MPDITDSAMQPGQRPSHRVRWGVAGAIGLAGTLGVTAFMVLPGVSAAPSDNVRICHATSSTSNPYTTPDINTSSVDEAGNKYLNGHGDHLGPVYEPGMTSGWGDIIPPFTSPSGTSFPGYNWSSAGQAIWNAGCTYASPSPTPTETSGSPTPTQTSGSPTPTQTSGSPTPTQTSGSPTPTQTSGSPTPTPTTTSPTPTPITTSPAPITTSPAPTFPPIFPTPTPTPTPTDTSATPTPTTTSPAPITTSPAPITTSPAPTPTSTTSVSPTPTVTPSPDGTPTPPAPIVTNGPGPTGGLPQAVPAGGGPGDAPQKPAWLWIVAAAFLGLLVASLRQLAPGRGLR